MKQLFTREEAYASMDRVKAYQTEVKSNITGQELEKLFEVIGLGDYFECESDVGTLYVRYYGPKEVVDISSSSEMEDNLDKLTYEIVKRINESGYRIGKHVIV